MKLLGLGTRASTGVSRDHGPSGGREDFPPRYEHGEQGAIDEESIRSDGSTSGRKSDESTPADAGSFKRGEANGGWQSRGTIKQRSFLESADEGGHSNSNGSRGIQRDHSVQGSGADVGVSTTTASGQEPVLSPARLERLPKDTSVRNETPATSTPGMIATRLNDDGGTVLEDASRPVDINTTNEDSGGSSGGDDSFATVNGNKRSRLGEDGAKPTVHFSASAAVVVPSTIRIPTVAPWEREDKVEDHEWLQGAPGATDQSLDTISLLSESAGPANIATVPRRLWMMPSRWSGQTVGVSIGAPIQEDDDGEVEAARLLARSLAAKLNDRVRRCEELEDLCGLRDDQVGRCAVWVDPAYH